MKLLMESWRKFLKEDIKLDIKKGDVLLSGRFKNKRIIVKDIGVDENGQPTINGRPALNFRIEKLLPDEKKSKKTLYMIYLIKFVSMKKFLLITCLLILMLHY